MPEEVERFFPGVQYPRLLGIQCQTKPIKNQLSLFQIKLWTFFAQDDEVIGKPHEMSIVSAFAEAFLFPRLIQPVQVEIREQGGVYSSYTIDTFSLSIVLSLSKHPLYASGRKFAVYRWRKSAPDQKASNLVQPEVTHYGKEEDAPSVDSASGTDLSPRSRRADRQSLRTRPANHPIKASPKNRRGGKSK